MAVGWGLQPHPTTMEPVASVRVKGALRRVLTRCAASAPALDTALSLNVIIHASVGCVSRYGSVTWRRVADAGALIAARAASMSPTRMTCSTPRVIAV